MFLTDGRFGSKDYGAKDISDYYQINGYSKTLSLINEVKKSKPWIK